MREREYDGFATEAEFLGYLAELEQKKLKYAGRSPEAIRQDRCRKRRRAAEKYWEVFLRTGSRPESWIKDLSASIVQTAKEKMVRKFPAQAKMRGLV